MTVKGENVNNCIKRLIIMLAVGGGFIVANGEVFFGPTDPTNRLIIKSNEVIHISRILGGANPRSDFIQAKLLVQGIELPVTFDQDVPDIDYRIAGPYELLLGTNVVISFRRQANILGIQTVLILPNQRHQVGVPAGKIIQVLGNTTGNALTITVGRGNKSVTATASVKSEFSGPVTLTFSKDKNTIETENPLLSYYIADDPEQVLSNPSVMFPIIIEKSAEMANWGSVASIYATSSVQRAFYRLKIAP